MNKFINSKIIGRSSCIRQNVDTKYNLVPLDYVPANIILSNELSPAAKVLFAKFYTLFNFDNIERYRVNVFNLAKEINAKPRIAKRSLKSLVHSGLIGVQICGSKFFVIGINNNKLKSETKNKNK